MGAAGVQRIDAFLADPDIDVVYAGSRGMSIFRKLSLQPRRQTRALRKPMALSAGAGK